MIGVPGVVPAVKSASSVDEVPPEPPNEVTWLPEPSTIATFSASLLARLLTVASDVPSVSCTLPTAVGSRPGSG